VIDDLLELSLQIIRGPARDRLTSTDLKLLKMAADGKIKTPETRRMFFETFRDMIEPGFLPAVSLVDARRPVPAPEPEREPEPAPVELPEEKPPARPPRPSGQTVYVIAARNIRRTSTDKADLDQLERTIFALSLIYPENMDLIARAVEYVLEHQLGTTYSDTEQLHRLQDGLREVRRAVDGLRERARERTLELNEKAARMFDSEEPTEPEPRDIEAEERNEAELLHFRGVANRNPGTYKPRTVSQDLRPTVGKKNDLFDKNAMWDSKLTQRENWQNIKNHGRSVYRQMCQEYA
jgi:hypothetical protein